MYQSDPKIKNEVRTKINQMTPTFRFDYYWHPYFITITFSSPRSRSVDKPQTMKLILAFALTTGAAAFTAPYFTV
jgi:hypothetical protein